MGLGSMHQRTRIQIRGRAPFVGCLQPSRSVHCQYLMGGEWCVVSDVLWVCMLATEY